MTSGLGVDSQQLQIGLIVSCFEGKSLEQAALWVKVSRAQPEPIYQMRIQLPPGTLGSKSRCVVGGKGG